LTFCVSCLCIPPADSLFPQRRDFLRGWTIIRDLDLGTFFALFYDHAQPGAWQVQENVFRGEAQRAKQFMDGQGFQQRRVDFLHVAHSD